MPFAPGISGNPSGRPKVTLADGRTLSEIAREHTEAAIATLVEVATCGAETGSARVSAATALLDRGWGRPKQASDDMMGVVDQSGPLQGRILTPQETMRVIEFIFGSERIEQALAGSVGYLEHQ